MTIYDTLRTQSLSVIKTYGMPVKILKHSGTTISTYGVWGKNETTDVVEAASALVTVAIKKLYIPNIKVAPELGDMVVVGKTTYTIFSFETYQGDDTAVAYCLTVKA